MISPFELTLFLSLSIRFSVARFVEILPLWGNFYKSLAIFEDLFNIWQNCEPTLATI